MRADNEERNMTNEKTETAKNGTATSILWATKKTDGRKTVIAAVTFPTGDARAMAIARDIVAEIRAKFNADEKTPTTWARNVNVIGYRSVESIGTATRAGGYRADRVIAISKIS
jgi:hypothetical protein